jgi:hypothetical protein
MLGWEGVAQALLPLLQLKLLEQTEDVYENKGQGRSTRAPACARE